LERPVVAQVDWDAQHFFFFVEQQPERAARAKTAVKARVKVLFIAARIAGFP
jgi:hypothetical protein